MHMLSSFGRRLRRLPINAFTAIRQNPKSVALGGLYTINFACACHLFLEYVATVQIVYGPSMLPTMSEAGELVVENRMRYRIDPRNLKRGDLVTLESPIEPGRFICKRVLGLPGDTICVDPTGLKAPSTEHVFIPKGHCWLVGDNAALARDSRDYGPVPMSLIRVIPFPQLQDFSDLSVVFELVRLLSHETHMHYLVR
ncbi:LexA/Signal peptidase [Auriscalpium vulgare]|uniref:LexA/Signal peptidase n=1 Tax=Auriscalpium vulgare TaxID=40419 RepID=A0ACB8RGR3_9AGAM|nr:LexA/Signal peptidase [Auriscalpium vulgare]